MVDVVDVVDVDIVVVVELAVTSERGNQPQIVFKGPVAWTRKRPETGPNRTDLDRTAVAVAPPFSDG